MLAIPVENEEDKNKPVRIGHYAQGGQGNRIYSVKGKTVCIQANGGGRGAKTGLYKIDLPDGDYKIRKLTPVEAERCQTLPDGYTAGLSDTQRYRCIGNGWTVNVIAHILHNIIEYDDLKDERTAAIQMTKTDDLLKDWQEMIENTEKEEEI